MASHSVKAASQWIPPANSNGSKASTRLTPATLSETKGLWGRVQWGRKGENDIQETVQFWVSRLGLMFAMSCLCERLLKACASRQEKPPLCNENSAPAHAHICD